MNLTEAEAAARVEEIFGPYHDRITAELDQRERNGRPTILVSMHSFTPVFKGESRRMQVAVLYNRDPRFARIMHELLLAEGDLVVGDNDPYALSDETDYTIPVHGERRGLPHVELEIRQDLIADEAGQQAWASRLVRLLRAAHARFPTRDAAEEAWDDGADTDPRGARGADRDDPPLHRRAELLRPSRRLRMEGTRGSRARGKARLLLRAARDPCGAEHAAPAGRLPAGRGRGDVHADPRA